MAAKKAAAKKAPAKKKSAAPAGGDDSPDSDDPGSGDVAAPVKHRTDDDVPLIRSLAARRAALRS